MPGSRDGVEGLRGVPEVIDVEDSFGIGQMKRFESIINASLGRPEVGDAGRGGDACANKHDDFVYLAAFDQVGDVFDISHFVTAECLNILLMMVVIHRWRGLRF